jgi:hypothetical protein
VGGIGNALTADFADQSFDGLDRADTFAANGQCRNISQGFAAETAIRRKDCIEDAAEAGREDLAEGIDGLARGRLRNKASSNRR